MYEIDNNVPLPEFVSSGRPARYPFKTMSVGDSFHVPFSDASNHKVRQRASNAGCKLRMTFRTIIDEQGTRVFRLK